MDDLAVRLLVNGLRVALEENASEVTKEHVIRALHRADLTMPPARAESPYAPSAAAELPLAEDVMTIILNIGGPDNLQGESLRAALERSQ